jgi:hypothetical protein
MPNAIDLEAGIVAIAARARGGDGKCYHTDPTCERLTRCRSVHYYSLDSLECINRRECAVCQGEVRESDYTKSDAYRALTGASQ